MHNETKIVNAVSRIHFGSRAISCSNVHGDFPVHERFWFCLVQVSTTQFSLFAAFPSVFMATDRSCEDAMHTSLPGSPPLLSNVGSPNGSGHDLDGMASRSTDEQLREIRELLLPLVQFARSVANCENHIQTITNSVVLLTSRITNIEQIVNTFSTKMASLAEMEQNYSSLTARLCKVEGDMVSASSVSGSARSWNVIGQNDGSTAAGSHGPGSSDDNRNTRRRLDTLLSTQDERPRSAVLFRFSCEQYLKWITKWIDTLWE